MLAAAGCLGPQLPPWQAVHAPVLGQAARLLAHGRRARTTSAEATAQGGEADEQGLEVLALEPKERLQQLLDATFLRRRSCDRRGDMPGRLRLRRVLRAPLWGQPYKAFAGRREELRATIGAAGCAGLAPPARTAGLVEALAALGEGPSLSVGEAVSGLNECYLFHGTCLGDALKIVRGGFDLQSTGSQKAQECGHLLCGVLIESR